MSETALLENKNKIPLECSIEEFSSSASSVPSSNNTKKLFKNSTQQPQVNFLIKNSESDQDCQLTCFTNPLAEDLELDLEVTGSNPAEVITEAETVPLVVDPDLEIKVRRACERISENVHICANEPSLAFFRLSEHVRKALPPTVESRQQVQTIQRQLGAAYEDADVALQEVQSMEHAAPMLNSTMEMLREAIKLQQQVKQEQSKSFFSSVRARQRRQPSLALTAS